jgi:hypothetical protein
MALMQSPENNIEDNNALMLKCHNRLISSYSRWASGLSSAPSLSNRASGNIVNSNNNNSRPNSAPQSPPVNTNTTTTLNNSAEERRERILPVNFTEILATVNAHVAKNRKAFIDAERRRGDLTYLYVAQIDNEDEENSAPVIQQKLMYSYVAEAFMGAENDLNNDSNAGSSSVSSASNSNSNLSRSNSSNSNLQNTSDVQKLGSIQ